MNKLEKRRIVQQYLQYDKPILDRTGNTYDAYEGLVIHGLIEECPVTFTSSAIGALAAYCRGDLATFAFSFDAAKNYQSLYTYDDNGIAVKTNTPAEIAEIGQKRADWIRDQCKKLLTIIM